jgi:hypothetical protein
VALGEEYLRRKKRSALARILAALRFRVAKIIRAPAISELEFIKITGNHGAYAEKLRQLGLHEASNEITKNSLHVGLCWWHLAREHLEDAKIALQEGEGRLCPGHITQFTMRRRRLDILHLEQ